MSLKRAQLRYFVTIAEEAQITRAAARLHIAQPALSHAISQLESELGVELLVRHARGVTLTPAGEALLPKARAALASEQEVEQTARSLARAASGVIDIGFVGPPPAMSIPELFEAFAEMHPESEASFRDLPFPRGSTRSWLEQVDVVFCHPPAVEAGIYVQPVRVEPRAVVVHNSHALADRSEIAVSEVLDETFIGYHPDVQPSWSSFHCLDDHRGAPPRSMTPDRVVTTLQMLGTIGKGQGITAVPLCDAKLAEQALPDVVAIPLHDARPAVLSLVWQEENPHPLIPDLVAAAERRLPG